MRFIALCSLSICSLHLLHPYREIHTITEVLAYVTPDTLCLWDIDNTLIEPDNPDGYGSDQWVDALISHCRQQGIAPHAIWNTIVPHYYTAQHHIAVKPIESNTAEVISHIQTLCPTLCITARDRALHKVTHRQLHSVNIHFKTHHTEECIEIPGLEHPCMYHNGILFVEGNDKGKVLQAYCHCHGITPQRIIFIDDRLKHVQAVEQAILDMGIPQDDCICLHYLYTAPKVHSFVLHENLIPEHFPLIRQEKDSPH